MKFEKQKNIQLAKQDKSTAGEIDKPILPLVNRINSLREFYTTSSCSGRIVLLKESDKKQEDAFLFNKHEFISIAELKKELDKATRNYSGLIYFKQEPPIMHIASNTLEHAQKILNFAKLAGWKKSGIIASSRRFVCELVSTEHTALPIADKREILVQPHYLKILTKEANKKLIRGRKKINKFFRLLK